LIVVRALTKNFHDKKRGEVRAVDGVSFECADGQIFGLLGPNGAGKTTTLRLLSTILRPTSGTAAINGYDIVHQPEKVREQIGFLSGDTGLYGRLTAREMMAYFGQLYGMSHEQVLQRIDELATLLDMREYLDTKNDKLSTGMKQKVSIGRTLIHDPPVMILDEPTAGLDVIASRTIVDFIQQARQHRKCIVLSTHDMREAEKLCDRIGIIHLGKVHAVGTLRELQAQTGEEDLERIFLKVVGEL